MLLGVAAVHAEEVGGEKRRLVAAGARPHLQDGALLVGRILGQEVHPQVLLEIGQARFQPGELLARHRCQLLVGGGIGQQRLELTALGLRLAQRLDGGHDRVELGELPGQLHAGCLRNALVELGLDALPALNELVELLGGYGSHRLGRGG